MNRITLNPYDSLKNPISIKLLLAGTVFLLIAIAPSILVLLKDGFSVGLVGTGLWLLVMGLLALFCVRLARRIAHGFQELKLDGNSLVCVSRDGDIRIPVSDVDVVVVDKILANFIGFEIVLAHDLNVVQIAVGKSKRDLEPIYQTLMKWIDPDDE